MILYVFSPGNSKLRSVAALAIGRQNEVNGLRNRLIFNGLKDCHLTEMGVGNRGNGGKSLVFNGLGVMVYEFNQFPFTFTGEKVFYFRMKLQIDYSNGILHGVTGKPPLGEYWAVVLHGGVYWWTGSKRFKLRPNGKGQSYTMGRVNCPCELVAAKDGNGESLEFVLIRPGEPRDKVSAQVDLKSRMIKGNRETLDTLASDPPQGEHWVVVLDENGARFVGSRKLRFRKNKDRIPLEKGQVCVDGKPGCPFELERTITPDGRRVTFALVNAWHRRRRAVKIPVFE